jgi:polyphosphate kinase
MDNYQYIEKELSWLSFNHRVLQEAQDSTVPLLERLRFLGIYSSNMDEFYRVRVANVRRTVLLSKNKFEKKQAVILFEKIQDKVIQLQREFDETYIFLLRKLADNNINLINEKQLTQAQGNWLSEYYKNKLRRHIFPIIIDDEVNLADNINDDCTYLMVEMSKQDKKQYALVEVPSSNVPRFVELPDLKKDHSKNIILLDNIIRHCLTEIFIGFFDFDSISAYSMKLTRDAELDLKQEFSQSLLEQMNSSLKKRLNAVPVRLVYDHKMPESMLSTLKKHMSIVNNQGLISGGRYHSFKDFIEFPSMDNKALEFTKIPALEQPHFSQYDNAFSAISHRDILLYYPYQKFSHFTELLRQSAFDPKVQSIEICLYRVAKKSRVVSALIEAVKNGKAVKVNIELQARFDEQDNLMWAEKLTNAGAEVSYGIPGLKVHAKICLIARKENNKVKHYAHIGTGNFNEKNAKIYTDFSLFTCDKNITKEVKDVFALLKHPYKKFTFKHLMVSPVNARHEIEKLINNEIAAAIAGKPNGITLKVNNLVDEKLINKLYEANNAGVSINLIVRGICSLVTGIVGQSENIHAISIVGRYLEHPRVAIFKNNGDPKVYISSADWMSRNIDQRVEVGCPILCPHVKQTILDIINIQLLDNTKARILNTLQSNLYQEKITNIASHNQAQIDIHDYLAKQKHQVTRQPIFRDAKTNKPQVSV